MGSEAKAFREGDFVRVRTTFTSDSESKVELREGETGFVEMIDAGGNAQIRFEGRSGYQWVHKRSLQNVQAAEAFSVGDVIRVRAACISDSLYKVELKKGEIGHISRFSGGGAQIIFRDRSAMHWIGKRNLWNLQAAFAVGDFIKVRTTFTSDSKDGV